MNDNKSPYAPRNKRGTKPAEARGKGTAYPEALTEGDWTVRDANASDKILPTGTDLKNKEMTIPTGQFAADKSMRAQEMGHVKLSPERVPDEINPVVMNAIESMRANAFLTRRAGIRYEDDLELTPELRREIRKRNKTAVSNLHQLSPDKQMLMAVAAMDTAQEDFILGNVDTDIKEAARHTYEALWAYSEGKLDFQSAYDLALILQSQLADYADEYTPRNPPPLKIELPMGGAGGGAAPDGDFEAPAPQPSAKKGEEKDGEERELPDAKEIRLGLDAIPDHLKARFNNWRAYKVTDEELFKMYKAGQSGTPSHKRPGLIPQQENAMHFNPWYPMRISVPEMSLPALPPDHAKMRNKWKGSDRGAIPTHMHRWAIDRFIFGKKRENKAGISVLVDVSGSMSLSSHDLVRILEEVPAAIVAKYNQRGDDHGDLVILAQKGRRVSDAKVGEGSGGGNGIDLPALEWLSRQNGPRYWVSDGGVTGQGDGVSYVNSKQCYLECMQNDIYQVQDVDELIAVMTGQQDLGPLSILGISPGRTHHWNFTDAIESEWDDAEVSVDDFQTVSSSGS